MLRRRSPLALLTALCVLAVAPGAASAATVANTNDSGPGSLRQAVIDAADGETITVPPGNYTLTSGEIVTEKSLTIAGAGAGATTIRAIGSRVFLIAGSGRGLTVSGVSFRDSTRSGETIQGGVIQAIEADLTLNGVVLTGNVLDVTQPAKKAGTIQGGLISVIKGSLAILDSRIAGNTYDASGGDNQEGGSVQGGSIVQILDATDSFTMTGTTIANNLIDLRGGLAKNSGVAQGGQLLIAAEKSARMTIRSSSIVANPIEGIAGAGGDGGVVQGGGLAMTNGSIDLIESTIAANVARTGSTGLIMGAGALFTASSPDRISFVSSTIAANGGDGEPLSSGGNLLLSGSVSFANTVVAGGIGQSGSENCAFVESAVTSKGFNLDSLNQCGFNAPGDLVNRDPQLGPVAENGGPTPTMQPAPTSPLVDQGAAFGLNADQRGVLRPIDFPSIPNTPGGDGSDIGAVELQPSNAFAIGKLKKNRKKGTARLTVTLAAPAAGTLALTGKGLKTRTAAVGARSTVTFVVATKGKAKKALRKRGKRKVAISVTYAPAGASAVTQTRKTKLVRKKPRPKGGKEKPSKARG